MRLSVSQLVPVLRALSVSLRSGVSVPADSEKVARAAAAIEVLTREKLRWMDRMVNPPMMIVPVTPEDVADAKRFRTLKALPWWRRVARVLRLSRAPSEENADGH